MTRHDSPALIELGNRMRERRIVLGYSQMNAAVLSDLHFTNYAKIERGEVNPSLYTLIRIATALNMDTGELVSGIDSSYLPDPEKSNVVTGLRYQQVRRVESDETSG